MQNFRSLAAFGRPAAAYPPFVLLFGLQLTKVEHPWNKRYFLKFVVILIVFQNLSETKLMRAWNVFGSVFILSQIFPCFSLIATECNLVTFISKTKSIT